MTCRCDNRPHTNGSRISDLGCISSRSCTPPYKRRCDIVRRTNTPNPCAYTAFIRLNTHRHTRSCPAVGVYGITTDKCNRNQPVYLRSARHLARRRIAGLSRATIAVGFTAYHRVSARGQRIAVERRRADALFLMVYRRAQSVYAARGR